MQQSDSQKGKPSMISTTEEVVTEVLTEMRKNDSIISQLSQNVQGDNKIDHSEYFDFNDREIVQEQEKEKDQEQKQEVFRVVRPISGRDPNKDTSWPLRSLVTGSRSAVFRLGTFYQLKEFKISNSALPIPYPHNLLASENYAPFIPVEGGRRLKNVNVLMSWSPPRPLSAFEEKESLEQAALELSGVTGMDHDNCIELAKMFAGDTNRAAMYFLNQGPEAFLNRLAEHQEAAALRLSMSSGDPNLDKEGKRESRNGLILDEEDTFFVIISLDEAESIRRAMQVENSETAKSLRKSVKLYSLDGLLLTSQQLDQLNGESSCSSNNGISPKTSSVSLNPPKLLRQTTTEILEPVNNPRPQDLAVQAARFFDSQLWYDDTEIIWLLRALNSAAESERRVAFESTSDCRLRDRPDWKGTSISNLFYYSNYDQLLRLRVVIVKVQRRLAAQFESTKLAFKGLDTNETGFLTFADLAKALQGLPDLENITEADCAALMKYIDHNSDGYIEYRDFVRAFSFPSIIGTRCNDNFDTFEVQDEDVKFGLRLVERTRRFWSQRRSLKYSEVENDSHGRSNYTDMKLTNTAVRMMNSKKGTSPSASSVTHGVANDTAALQSITRFVSQGKSPHRAKHTQVFDLAQVGKIVLTSVHGGTSQVMVDNDNLVSSQPGMHPSVAPRGVLLGRNSGSWYFEILVVTPGNAFVGVGDAFYTGNSQRAQGLGDDAHSWGYSGYTCQRKHNGASSPFGFAWKSGDVVGCMIDTDTGDISFTLNGNSDRPLGLAFSNIYASGCSGGVVPVVSFDPAFTFRFNLGKTLMRYAPPALEAQSISRWIQKKVEFDYAAKSGGQYGKLVATTGDAGINIDGLRVQPTSGFPSCIMMGVLLVGGKWYYEIKIENPGVASQFGWADLDFIGTSSGGQGVGDDKVSWAFDGDRECTWHNGSQRYGKRWKSGDVVGVAADVDAGTISFSLNGSWAKPMGVAFSNVKINGGLSPGFTGNPGVEILINFGATPFQHKPPDPNYEPVQKWIREHNPNNNVTSYAGLPGPSRLLKMATNIRTHTPFLERSRVEMRPSSGSLEVEVDREGCVRPTGLDSTSYPSVVADGIAITSGRWYYEVTVIDSVPEGARCSLGWADHEFLGTWNKSLGVGDNEHSWGCVYHDGKNNLQSKTNANSLLELDSGKTGLRLNCLNRGDVLGFLLDCDTRVMRVSINGTWMKRPCFTDFEFSGGLKPAVSASGTKVMSKGQIPMHFCFQFNFGHRPFENNRMATGYKSIHQWMLAEQARVRVLTGAEANLDASQAAEDGEAKGEEVRTKWIVDRLKNSDRASNLCELLGIEGDNEIRAAKLASELGLI